MTDARVARLLDELTPNYDDRVGDWGRVAADARDATRHRVAIAMRWRIGGLVAAVAAAAALVLAWPLGNEHGSVLDRALAAVGDGPVLHVILRGEWGGTLVDLGSGERKPVYGDNEVWFDTESGQTHSIERLGGVVQAEELGTPKKPAAALAALGREYRQAIESGTARISGEDAIDGEPVVWITIHSELPDVADGKDHEWAQQVAVSKRTFKPIALRETRDGQPGPGTLQRVLELQLLSRSEGDFTASRPSRNGSALRQSRERIELGQAPAVLGHTPLWLGRDHDGLPLAEVYRETTSLGDLHQVRVTGAKAAAAIRCSQLPGDDAGVCFRALGLRSVEVRPDGVFTSQGPIRWGDEQSGVVFFYGTLGDDTSSYPEDTVPQLDTRYLTVTESTRLSPLRRGAGSYIPPMGSVFVAAGGRTGFMQNDGLQISIAAGDEDSVLAAAHALVPTTR